VLFLVVLPHRFWDDLPSLRPTREVSGFGVRYHFVKIKLPTLSLQTAERQGWGNLPCQIRKASISNQAFSALKTVSCTMSSKDAASSATTLILELHRISS
jgi:hypothetical protein